MLGLGIMGSAMAANLLRAGFRGGRLRPGGGLPAAPPQGRRHRRRQYRDGRRAAASILITSLPSANALLEVAKEIPHKKRGQIVIETSTLADRGQGSGAQRLAAAGVTLLDCPLSGTGAQARVKDLVVFGSGDRAAFKKTIPVLKGFSRGHYYLGKFGNGSKMKFAANLLVAIHNVSTAEAVILARRSGLDPALAVKVLGDGAGASRMLQVRGPADGAALLPARHRDQRDLAEGHEDHRRVRARTEEPRAALHRDQGDLQRRPGAGPRARTTPPRSARCWSAGKQKPD